MSQLIFYIASTVSHILNNTDWDALVLGRIYNPLLAEDLYVVGVVQEPDNNCAPAA